MTIRSEATRLVASSSSSVFSDGGLSTLCRDLKDIYDASAEEDVVSDVRSHLQTTYGTQNVLEQAHAVEFEWVWDPVQEKWVKKKIQGSTFTIDDGQTNDLRAVVLIQEAVS